MKKKLGLTIMAMALLVPSLTACKYTPKVGQNVSQSATEEDLKVGLEVNKIFVNVTSGHKAYDGYKVIEKKETKKDGATIYSLALKNEKGKTAKMEITSTKDGNRITKSDLEKYLVTDKIEIPKDVEWKTHEISVHDKDSEDKKIYYVKDGQPTENATSDKKVSVNAKFSETELELDGLKIGLKKDGEPELKNDVLYNKYKSEDGQILAEYVFDFNTQSDYLHISTSAEIGEGDSATKMVINEIFHRQ